MVIASDSFAEFASDLHAESTFPLGPAPVGAFIKGDNVITFSCSNTWNLDLSGSGTGTVSFQLEGTLGG